MPRRLFVGFGSPHGDDSIGWLASDALAARCLDGWDVRKAAIPADLFDWLEGADQLTLCDACVSDRVPGTIVKARWPEFPMALRRNAGSHDLGLAETLSIADRLGLLPRRTEIVAVELACCQPGQPLSDEVANALPRLIDSITSEWQHA